MPPSKGKSGCGIKIDATGKFFSVRLNFSGFPWSTPWGGFQKISKAQLKTALLIPYLVKGTENFLPEGLIFWSSRDLPLEGRIFPVIPVKTVLPIPKLVRGFKKTSAQLNFSPFSWPTTWGTNFSGDTHKIDSSHSSLSEGIYWKMAITRKFFLQALIFHRSRDLPLERERVFSGTPKNTHLNLLASEGVPQEHPFPSPEKEVIHQLTTE